MDCYVWMFELDCQIKAYFASTESCWTPSSVDFPAFADCLGEDPQSAVGQDSEKPGCPSVAPKRLSDSCWLAVLTECTCGRDCCFERTGLEVCKRTQQYRKSEASNQMGQMSAACVTCETYCLLLFLWEGPAHGWVVLCFPHSGCCWEGTLPCE